MTGNDAVDGLTDETRRLDRSCYKRPISIALVCDYFHPKVRIALDAALAQKWQVGGVESHIYQLGQLLLGLGHRVVVVSHSYRPDRHGVRYLSCGLKVYYLPIEVISPSTHATLPAFFHAFPHLRQIFMRERIELVHTHVALSALGMEAILHARTLGLKAVFTDHSLLGLGGYGEIWGNKVSKACLSDLEAAICVSHTAKENTVLRCALDPSLVHVIPNAVVASAFLPARPPLRTDAEITIVCVSRLVYRKGIDLLIGALPRVCAAHSDVRFVIGLQRGRRGAADRSAAGDGPKTIELEQMRERHQALLGDRVELIGAVRHELVRDVLVRGHIFLNTSLTEAFGIGILEAACAGLYIVSTRVGGVPEILPPDLIDFAEPDVDGPS